MILEFYKKHYRVVYGYLLSLCGDVTLAEDLTSEVFLRALEHIDSYDSRYKAATWLCSIGMHLYFNRCKQEKKQLSLDETQLCSTPSPEALYLQKEQAENILRAAQHLPPIPRQVLFMRLEGMSFRDIGQALSKSESWARVTYYRAKAKIISETEETP